MAPYGTDDFDHINLDNGMIPESDNTKPLPEPIIVH